MRLGLLVVDLRELDDLAAGLVETDVHVVQQRRHQPVHVLDDREPGDAMM